MSGRSIPKTFRIREEVLNEIDSRADEYRMSANQLVNRWLEKCLFLDVLWRHLDAVTIGRITLVRIIESADKDRLEKIGSDLGKTIVTHLFTLYNVEPDWSSVIYALEEAYSNACNWFEFKHYTHNDTHQLICKHKLGINWSNFLKGYIGSILKNLLNVKPKVEADDQIVKFTT